MLKSCSPFPVCFLGIHLSLLMFAGGFADDRFTSLFNGQDLSGWDGDPDRWSVQDGVVVGKSAGGLSLATNATFILRPSTPG